MWPSAGAGSINRITVPVNGIYQVTASLAWTGDSSGGRRSIELNGTQADNVTPFGPLGTSNMDAVAGAASETFQTFSGIYKLTAGQSVSILAGATALSNASTCFGNINQRASTMSVTYLNPGP
jgi:hypothetical protein